MATFGFRFGVSKLNRWVVITTFWPSRERKVELEAAFHCLDPLVLVWECTKGGNEGDGEVDWETRRGVSFSISLLLPFINSPNSINSSKNDH